MKRKKISVFISTLALTLIISMSGCYRVSIKFENSDKKGSSAIIRFGSFSIIRYIV